MIDIIKDTDKDIDKIYKQLILSKSDEEKLMMGFSMMEITKKIILSSIEEKNPEKLKKEIFKRIYGKDFSTAEKNRFYKKLIL
ncbi:MAG: hypothetical protein FJW66_03345 [Actinobacteria bacterium]|nr:hypothetical protein [Actinomycetota bacterium]